MSGDVADLLHHASWGEFGRFLHTLSAVGEARFDQPLTSGRSVLDHMTELDGLTRFVTESLLGDAPDRREDTLSFDAQTRSLLPDLTDRTALLSTLTRGFEQLQEKILAAPDAVLLEHGRPMWQPSGMFSPAAAILTLARHSAYQRGQIDQLLKDVP